MANIMSLEKARQECEGMDDSEWAQYLEGLLRQWERAEERGETIHVEYPDE